VAVVTAAGYEYDVEKYEFRLSGLLNYFKSKKLSDEECHRFYLFGGECNYLLRLGNDFRLHPVQETGPGGWITATKHLSESPGNWSEDEIKTVLDAAEEAITESLNDQNLRGLVIRKYRSIGLVPQSGQEMRREALDETVLRCQSTLSMMNQGSGINLPFCAFNGGRDVWVDVGNKKVGVQILGSYLGFETSEILHIGDQFLNTGNDYAARDVCPCIWITSPAETTYILKQILELSGVNYVLDNKKVVAGILSGKSASAVDFAELDRRTAVVKEMDVFTGDIKTSV
jgi:IMP and pyridine-specific 5'-nucleotidase